MVRRWSLTDSKCSAKPHASSYESESSRSSASCASPIRPAAFRRGMSEKLKLVAVTGLPAAPDVCRSAAMHGRGFSLIRRRPSETSARFSSRMGMRSATVPSVAKSMRVRHRFGWPKRAPSTCTIFKATPTPARMALGQSGSHFGSATGTSGTRSDGSWWSVTTTCTPRSCSMRISSRHAMPQSTVTKKSGFACIRRSIAAGVMA